MPRDLVTRRLRGFARWGLTPRILGLLIATAVAVWHVLPAFHWIGPCSMTQPLDGVIFCPTPVAAYLVIDHRLPELILEGLILAGAVYLVIAVLRPWRSRSSSDR